ncbi:MAG TPA: prolyl oligopeptidase family serine peptidase [Gemmataceae bacterium]|nr:prolyl oligopeptidase family serine peptidase [Gemmataceae bacterium]
MSKLLLSLLPICLLFLPSVEIARAEETLDFVRTRDVIYGRKDGLALTMDVIAPRDKANGLGLIFVVSSGWRSRPEAILPEMYAPFFRRGYTVFAVVHGTQPRFTVPEIIPDMHRAVRFIRYHARDYHIDPDRLGITGGSAGGHLSLMIATAGAAGNPRAKDPVERVSSRVQAVACFVPPTDFLNWGTEGAVLDSKHMKDKRFKAAIDFQLFDPNEHIFKRVTDDMKVHEILRDISPISHVSRDDPPTLIIHGDEDKLVPLQQSRRMVAKLKEAGVPASLIVKKGYGHVWITILKDTETFADWFDQYLKKEPRRAAE